MHISNVSKTFIPHNNYSIQDAQYKALNSLKNVCVPKNLQNILTELNSLQLLPIYRWHKVEVITSTDINTQYNQNSNIKLNKYTDDFYCYYQGQLAPLTFTKKISEEQKDQLIKNAHYNGVIQQHELTYFVEKDILNNLSQTLPPHIKSDLEIIKNNAKCVAELKEHIKQNILTKIIDVKFLKNPSIMADLTQCLRYFNLTTEEQTKIASAYSKLFFNTNQATTLDIEHNIILLNVVQHINWNYSVAQYHIKKIILNNHYTQITLTTDWQKILQQKAQIICSITWRSDKDKLDLVKMISQHQLFTHYKSNNPSYIEENPQQKPLKNYIVDKDFSTFITLMNGIKSLETPESKPYITKTLNDYMKTLDYDYRYTMYHLSFMGEDEKYKSRVDYRGWICFNNDMRFSIFNTIIRLAQQDNGLPLSDKESVNNNIRTLKRILFESYYLEKVECESIQMKKEDMANNQRIRFTYLQYIKIAKVMGQDLRKVDAISLSKFNNHSEIYILIANQTLQPYLKDNLDWWFNQYNTSFVNPQTKEAPIFLRKKYI